MSVNILLIVSDYVVDYGVETVLIKKLLANFSYKEETLK